MNTNLQTFVKDFLEGMAEKFVKEYFFTGDFDNNTLEPSKWASAEENKENKEIAQHLADNNVQIKFEEHHGGEGEGEAYWSVYKFVSPDEEVYVKFNGSYTSYNGSDFDEWFFVEAVPVRAFDYRKIK